jgi:hypothetical protein
VFGNEGRLGQRCSRCIHRTTQNSAESGRERGIRRAGFRFIRDSSSGPLGP